MKTASVSELKNNLSACLKEVAAGEPLLITDRRKPVATLQALAQSDIPRNLASLCARGIVAPARKALSVSAFLRMPKGDGIIGLTEAVLDERNAR